MSTTRDLHSLDDIRCVVDAFYSDIAEDPLLGSYFAGIDLQAHLPRMYAFWSSIVFHTGAYHGRPFEKHVVLEALDAIHFQRWLERFRATIDARFAGPAAERMKQRAEQIATVFQIRLGLLDPLGKAGASD